MSAGFQLHEQAPASPAPAESKPGWVDAALPYTALSVTLSDLLSCMDAPLMEQPEKAIPGSLLDSTPTEAADRVEQQQVLQKPPPPDAAASAAAAELYPYEYEHPYNDIRRDYYDYQQYEFDGGIDDEAVKPASVCPGTVPAAEPMGSSRTAAIAITSQQLERSAQHRPAPPASRGLGGHKKSNFESRRTFGVRTIPAAVPSHYMSDQSTGAPPHNELEPSDSHSCMDFERPKALMSNSGDSSYQPPSLASPAAVDSGLRSGCWGGCFSPDVRASAAAAPPLPSPGPGQQHSTAEPAPPPLLGQRSLASLLLGDLELASGLLECGSTPLTATDEDARLLAEAAGAALVATRSNFTGFTTENITTTAAASASEPAAPPQPAGNAPTPEGDAFETFLRAHSEVAGAEARQPPRAAQEAGSERPLRLDSGGRSLSVGACNTGSSAMLGAPNAAANMTRHASLATATPTATTRKKTCAGPGTNRPPKRGSVSAQLPQDKLARKRAAARRYYHNQKNKMVDYEDVVSQLERENVELKRALQLATERLSLVRQERGGQRLQPC